MCVCVINKQTERQRYRETERQRDRETERQRDRETDSASKLNKLNKLNQNLFEISVKTIAL